MRLSQLHNSVRRPIGVLALLLMNAALWSASAASQTAGTWSPAASMIADRTNFAAVLLTNGNVLVTGGAVQGQYFYISEVYDPIRNAWTSTGNTLVPRTGPRATLLSNGKVLVSGGNGPSSNVLASAELYVPVRSTWSATGSMSVIRKFHTQSLLANGKILVTGGCGYRCLHS